MKGCFAFQQGRGGGFVFQVRGAVFLSGGGRPMRVISFNGEGGFEKTLKMVPPTPSPPSTMGNPEIGWLKF